MKRSTIQDAFLKQIGNLEIFQQLLETLPDVAFFMKDAQGRFILQNRCSLEYSGLNSEQEVVGKTDHDLFPKDRADLYVQSDRAVLESGQPILNLIEPAPESSNRLIVGNKFPLRNRRGKIIGIIGIHRIIDGMRDTPDWYGRIKRVVDYLHEHYRESIQLSDLTRRSGISQTHLERRFTKLIGYTPIEYLLRIRIAAAKELLEKTDRTISDIALEVGFFDHSHFTKTFRRIIACTPSHYRTHHTSKLR